ncbi:MAG: hypothetical protein ACRD2Z_10510 [Thermoanaerobaculia bacterium]
MRWSTLLEAAEAAGISRLYGGIHFTDGNLRGQELGRRVGLQAWAYARQFWDGDAAEPESDARSRTRVSRSPDRRPIRQDVPAAATRPGRDQSTGP